MRSTLVLCKKFRGLVNSLLLNNIFFQNHQRFINHNTQVGKKTDYVMLVLRLNYLFGPLTI